MPFKAMDILGMQTSDLCIFSLTIQYFTPVSLLQIQAGNIQLFETSNKQTAYPDR